MKRFIRRPSPAMVVALIALFVAMSGSAYAVVSFATNAGKVDGKDAVSAGVSNGYAAGKLIAAQRLGANAGKIPAKYLALPATGGNSMFAKTAEVPDNAVGAPVELFNVPGLGQLTVACNDDAPAANNEDPLSAYVYNNNTGVPVNFARAGTNVVVAPNTTATFSIDANAAYTVNLQAGAKSLVALGVFRQDGATTPAGICVNYGTVVQAG